MERNFLKFVWERTKPNQIWVCAIVFLSLPVYFVLLEVTKLIVNRPIQGIGYTPDTNQTVTFRFPDPTGLFGGDIFSGIVTTRTQDLFLLCAAFLALTIVNGVFKYYINTYKGRLGERTLREFRLELVTRVLRFPPDRMAGVKPSEISTMIKDEVEPMGGMIGDAFVRPILSGGLALTGIFFILSQNVALGCVAIAIILVQTAVIPRLRRQLVRLARARQLAARRLAGRVGELVEGAREIDVENTAVYERAEISNHLFKIFGIRYEIYRKKFLIKFLNNLLSQLTPLFFYSIGGYFAIRGQLDVGQLVAVIVAYREIPTPIRELISWDQQRVDIQSRYTQVIEQFDIPDLRPEEEAMGLDLGGGAALEGPVVLRKATLDGPHGRSLNAVDLTVHPEERLLITGDVEDGGEALSDLFTRRRKAVDGEVLIGDAPLSRVSRGASSQFFGYAGPHTVLPNRSILECLLSGLRQPPTLSQYGVEDNPIVATEDAPIDLSADWVDYARLGLEDAADLEQFALEILRALNFYDDALQLGLGARIAPDARPDLALDVLQARALMRFWLEEEQYLDLIEPFDRDHYAHEASIGVNLTFGAPKESRTATARFMMRRSIREVLKRRGLLQPLLDLGWRSAQIMTRRLDSDAFANAPSSRLFTQEDANTFRPLLARSSLGPPPSLSWTDQVDVLDIALRYIEPEHKLGLLTDDLREKILGVRFKLGWEFTATLRERFEAFDLDSYNQHATLSENVLFGNIRHGAGVGQEAAQGAKEVRELILDTLERLGMNDTLAIAGLTRHVGPGGRALTPVQRQKLALAKSVLRRPRVLLADRVLEALDVTEQQQIFTQLDELWTERGQRPAFVVVSRSPDLASSFDRVMDLRDQKLVAASRPAERPQRVE
ncbi:MAG: ABC transporter transmembrane domain-containing protein [Pseudomonadota bacterium]